MATSDAIFCLSNVDPTTGTILTTASSAEIAVGAGTLNGFVCDQDIHIRFGVTGMSASSTSYFRIPANTIFALEMSRNYGFVRLYNPSASTCRYHIVPLLRS